LPTLIEQHRLWVQTVGKSGKQLDLSDHDLRELKTLKKEKLTAIRAVGAKFFGLNLYKTELQSSMVDKSDFRNCDMEYADLRASSFKGAIFNHAQMAGVNASPLLLGQGAGGRFAITDFAGAQMRYADLKGAIFKNTNLQKVDLSYADLTGADLREADLTGAIMVGTILDEANLTGAHLPEVATGSAFSLKSLSDD
jgi:uncharacterized protein YjbI with pentapeptide repeats